MKASNKQMRSLTIEQPTFEGAIPAELSADYILPDVYPDVKKLLRVTAKPVLIGRFVSGKRLEFTGAVDYLVLFSADTEDGESLHSVHFAGEWNSALGELEDLEHSDIYISPKITSCTSRPSNPRKLSIRSIVASDVKVIRSSPCGVNVFGAESPSEELSLERLTETVPLRTVRTFTAEPLRISENIELDPSCPSADEIVSCTVNIHINEAKPRLEAGSLNVALKGTAFTSFIYKTLSEPRSYRSFSKNIPVSYIVGADEYAEHYRNCTPDSIAARITAVPVEINTVVGEDGYGERRVMELDMTADMNVRLLGSTDVPLTLDAYSTARDSECAFACINTALPARAVTANFSVGETVPRETLSLPEGAVILEGSATISPLNLTSERGRTVLTGNASVSCIYTVDGSLSSAEAAVPLRFELNAGEISENTAHICDVIASDIRCTVRDGVLSVDFEASLNAEIWEQSKRNVLESITLTGEPSANRSSSDITICYPGKNERMWDIAKRYGTSAAAIEAVNDKEKRVLMIPSAAPRSFVI